MRPLVRAEIDRERRPPPGRAANIRSLSHKRLRYRLVRGRYSILRLNYFTNTFPKARVVEPMEYVYWRLNLCTRTVLCS